MLFRNRLPLCLLRSFLLCRSSPPRPAHARRHQVSWMPTDGATSSSRTSPRIPRRARCCTSTGSAPKPAPPRRRSAGRQYSPAATSHAVELSRASTAQTQQQRDNDRRRILGTGARRPRSSCSRRRRKSSPSRKACAEARKELPASLERARAVSRRRSSCTRTTSRTSSARSPRCAKRHASGASADFQRRAFLFVRPQAAARFRHAASRGVVLAKAICLPTQHDGAARRSPVSICSRRQSCSSTSGCRALHESGGGKPLSAFEPQRRRHTHLDRIFKEAVLLTAAMGYARDNNCSYSEHGLHAFGERPRRLAPLVHRDAGRNRRARPEGFLIEFRHTEQQLKIAREERMLDQSQANRELIRNLAHEIKNPLGGIRGAAQLLDRELERPALHEYTQVIMKEADRLQLLMDRLLTPHRLPQPTQVNIHEVLERVRSVILAEFPRHHRAPRLRHEPADDRRRPRAAHPGGAQHRAQRGAGDARPGRDEIRLAHARRAAGDARAQALSPRR